MTSTTRRLLSEGRSPCKGCSARKYEADMSLLGRMRLHPGFVPQPRCGIATRFFDLIQINLGIYAAL